MGFISRFCRIIQQHLRSSTRIGCFFIRDSLTKVLICIIELSPNIVADIFYNYEIEGEH